MSSLTVKIHKYILPVGFAIIIALMIFTGLLTTTRMGSSTETIIKNQTDINNINRMLGFMASSNLERSHIIFKLAQNRDPIKLDHYIIDLYNESIIFQSAKKEYESYELSKTELSLLSQQAVMTIENILLINKAIRLQENKDYLQAIDIINRQVLPRNKGILGTIVKLHEVAHNVSHSKLEEAKIISSDTYKSIISIKIFSILLIFALMFYLIRKQRKSDKELSVLASTDTLTELPNRSSFIKNINQAIAQAKNSNTTLSVIFFDIDYFKSINDIYGHEVGDTVLNLFSSVIREKISPEDILSRFGGDEFVLLLKSKNQKDDIRSIVKELSQALDTSFIVDNYEIFVSASIGASTFPDDGSNAKQLLKNADIAMYTAKNSGRNCFKFYCIENSQKLEYEHTLSHALQTVIKNKNMDNELFLVYQPLVNIIDGEFYECEALIRWKDTNSNNINTTEFIEIAEKSNLIEKINLFVIEESCKQQYEWLQQGIDNIRININLSGNKRIFRNLFKSLSENLSRYDLDPKLFGIELTERTMYEVSDETINELKHFRNLGMKIAIDDFGTGYSSLSYLKDLPITSLKIDQKFISGLPTEKIDVALVKTIITLAHSLDLDVVAEGVETQEQLEFLRSCKCNIAQGYLLHKPLSSESISLLKLAA